MSSNKIICPVCGQSDQIEKVSTIYLEGIRVNRLRFSKNSEGVSLPPSRQRLLKIPAQDLYSLSRKLAPPSSKKTMPTRLPPPGYGRDRLQRYFAHFSVWDTEPTKEPVYPRSYNIGMLLWAILLQTGSSDRKVRTRESDQTRGANPH